MASLRDKTFLAALASGMARQSRLGIARLIRGSMEVGFGLGGYLLGFSYSMAFAMLFLCAWMIPLLATLVEAATHRSASALSIMVAFAIANLGILAYWIRLSSREYALLANKPSGWIDRAHAWIGSPIAAIFSDLQAGMAQPIPHPAYASIEPERTRTSLRLALGEGFGPAGLAADAFALGWLASRSFMGPLCRMSAFFLQSPVLVATVCRLGTCAAFGPQARPVEYGPTHQAPRAHRPQNQRRS